MSELLDTIKNWDEQPHEIIVVDAGHDPDSQQLCNQFDVRYFAFKKSRGAQQRFGAQHTSGDILWFLYADCRPDANSLSTIRQSLNKCKGGHFRFSFNLTKKHLTHKFLESIINWRSKYFIAYGDQGLFFDKATYFALDGHADQTLFEEVLLIKKIKKHGFTQCDSSLLVSPRKWEKDGYWKRTIRNRLLAMRYHFGSSSEQLKKKYYSE